MSAREAEVLQLVAEGLTEGQSRRSSTLALAPSGAPALDLQEARGALAGRSRQSSGRARSYLGPCRRFRAMPYSSAKPSSRPGCMVGREQKRRRDKDGEGASTRDSP
jgi:hypothetical protein